MSIPAIDLNTIEYNSTTQSFSKGETYYQAGAVAALTQRGNLLQAEVEGSESLPYRVTVEFGAEEIGSAHCTCPYDFGGWCKHIVAVLLGGVHQPETIENRPSLAELLERVDLSQAKQVLRELIAEHPDLIDDLDRQVNLITTVSTPAKSSPTSPKTTRPAIDPAPFRRQVRQVFQDAVNGWEEGEDEDSIVEEILAIVFKAEQFFEAGDGENALAVLSGITEGCADGWEEVDNYGADSEEVVIILDRAWTEAILTAQLTEERQTQLRSQLEVWLSEWGQDLPMTVTALEQGWSYPPLQRVLNGEITKLGAWAGESPYFADDLATIRLNILFRQERYQEYLYLAEAEGQVAQYLTMLARMGQIEAAMTAAQTLMTTVDEAYALAKILNQQGADAQALAIAQTGLTLSGNPLYDLAIWTSDLAESLGNLPVAITARVTAFKSKPSFQNYQKIERWAGADWAALRLELLQSLEQSTRWGLYEERVNILLYESEIDRAIAIVKNLSYYESSLIYRVMDAAMSERPDWVIENARQRAEEIMNPGKADAYHHAVDWLKKVKGAYQKSWRQAEWTDYYQQLSQTHARKYKLMGLLREL